MDEQQLITLGIVGIAAGHLFWYAWRKVKRSRDGDFCSGCGSCGRPKETALLNARPAPQATPLITLSSAPPRRNPRPPG